LAEERRFSTPTTTLSSTDTCCIQPKDWEFSSYGYYLREKGEEWLADCWERYPVIDYIEGDDFGGPIDTA